MPTVKVDRVADALNISPQRVQQLVKEGMPREKRGEYDPIKCLLWYVRYLQAQVARLSPNVDLVAGEVDSERKERLGLLRADRELRELELARERGEYMALTDVEKILSDLVIMTKARILTVANRVSPQLVGESRDVIEARLDHALKEALSVMAAQGSENGDAGNTDTRKRVTPLAATDPRARP